MSVRRQKRNIFVAILVLFVNRVIGFSETDSSVLFHGFTVLAYITPILVTM